MADEKDSPAGTGKITSNSDGTEQSMMLPNDDDPVAVADEHITAAQTISNPPTGENSTWNQFVYSKNAVAMMEKMGFQKSKGIGINNQGRKEPLLLPKLEKKRGLGFGSCTEKEKEAKVKIFDDGNDEETQVLIFKAEVASVEKTKSLSKISTPRSTPTRSLSKISPPSKPIFKITPKKLTKPPKKVSLVPYLREDDDSEEDESEHDV